MPKISKGKDYDVSVLWSLVLIVRFYVGGEKLRVVDQDSWMTWWYLFPKGSEEMGLWGLLF